MVRRREKTVSQFVMVVRCRIDLRRLRHESVKPAPDNDRNDAAAVGATRALRHDSPRMMRERRKTKTTDHVIIGRSDPTLHSAGTFKVTPRVCLF